MHTCMIAIGLTAQTQTHRHAGSCAAEFFVIVCACGVLYIQLSMRQSIFPALPTSYCSSVCVLFAHPIFIQGRAETFGWLSQSRYIPTPMPCITQLRNHPHANKEACSNAMSGLKKTRDKKLRDSRRWCLGSTSSRSDSQ